MEIESFYDRPLIYDILHAPGTDEEVEGLVRICRRFSPRARRPVWLEPFCGTGRYLRAAARRGFPGIGVDGDAGMIAYARRRTLRTWRGRGVAGVRYHVAAAETVARCVAGGSADFAIAPINSIRHLESDAAVLAHFRGMHGCLKPGAVYAVGLDFARYGRDCVEEDIWDGVRGPLRVTQVCQYLPADRSDRMETVVSHVTCVRPSGVEHLDFRYTLRAYDRAEWAELVGRSRFRIEAVVDGTGEDTDPDVFDYAIQILRRC